MFVVAQTADLAVVMMLTVIVTHKEQLSRRINNRPLVLLSAAPHLQSGEKIHMLRMAGTKITWPCGMLHLHNSNKARQVVKVSNQAHQALELLPTRIESHRILKVSIS